ncbi:beta-lactamase/transpeptidase-like protein [Xylariaceae sp. FL0255]|nr:beta-lactamase/transpeptidase-like protein [Xylariaceae sp. FL0255]
MAADGKLINENKAHDRVQDYLSDFNLREDPRIRRTATIADLCCHSTGIANGNTVFLGPGGTIIVKEGDHLAIVNGLPTSNEHGQRFNSWWYYNNAAFGLLAHVIDKSFGSHFATFLRERLCSPLELNQTLLTDADVHNNTNVAHSYVQRNDKDGTWAKIAKAYTSERHGPTLATIGVRSSVNDMLAFLAAVMNRYDSENESKHSQQLLARYQKNPPQRISSMWDWWWGRPCDDRLV